MSNQVDFYHWNLYLRNSFQNLSATRYWSPVFVPDSFLWLKVPKSIKDEQPLVS